MKGAFLVLLGSALSVDALNLVRRDNPAVLGLPIQRRTAPAPGLRRFAKRGTVNAELDQLEKVLYAATVAVGTPAQNVKLDLDTGSSDMWVFTPQASFCANNGCHVNGLYDQSKSSTVKVLNTVFNSSYGDGTIANGPMAIDKITIGGASLNYQFGLAVNYSSQVGNENTTTGLLGVGYPDLEAVDSTDVYPNLPLALAKAGLVNSAAFSLWLDDLASSKGQILFGGVNKAKYHGNLAVLDLVSGTVGSQSTEYYVTMSGISSTNNGKTTAGPNTVAPALLDSGTQSSDIPAEYVEFIINALNGSIDATTGSFVAPCSMRQSNVTIGFAFGGLIISVPAKELLTSDEVDPSTGKPLVDSKNNPLCAIDVSAAQDGSPVILGDSFLRSAYVVYDQPNKQVAMANTNFDSTTDDIVEITTDTTNTEQPDTIPGITSLIAAPSAAATATDTNAGGIATTKVTSASGVPIITSRPQSTKGSGSTSGAAPAVYASNSMLGMLFGLAFAVFA